MSEIHLPIGIKSPKEYQRQCIVIHNRMTKRQQAIQGLKQHLKNGTFPKRMKFLKPRHPIESSEGKAKVHEALQQVARVILDEKVQDYERKLKGDRESLQSLKDTHRVQRQQWKVTQNLTVSKKVTVTQLQKELRDLQVKYTELAQKVIPSES